ncbi:MAG: T9SS type A sorting domain-containing protein [Flavobacteriales bacterium]|nr:T9SS type A sorting domain-containing protein [Flavobacteriales bacterium]
MFRKTVYILSLTFLFSSGNLLAQMYTWAEDIAPIMYENCSSCHHDGGIGPFNIMGYDDVLSSIDDVVHVIEEGIMPPWPADPEYMHFADESVLSEAEIEAILTWVDIGMPIGDQNVEPDPPVFLPSGSLLDQIDFTIEIPEYTLQQNYDEYRWFVIENPFNEPFYISKLEVIVGLESVVHHADLFLDYSGTSLYYDELDPLPGFNGSTGYPVNDHYINAWQPGGNPAEYPPNWGVMVPPDADLVVEIHYGPGGIGQIDDTKMNIQFVQNTDNVRPVYASWLLNHGNMTDGPLVIPANQVVSFHQETQALSNDLSLISICPHMHYLGKSYEVWYEMPNGEEFPLIYIDNWDIHWQKYYVYQQVKHIPAGAVIKSEGYYDNTLANHDNPFDPPETAYLGSTTLDEMFLTYFIYAYYQEGDENIIMDSTIVTGIEEEVSRSLSERTQLYPNPVGEFLQVELPDEIKGNVLVTVYDQRGKPVLKSKTPLAQSKIRSIDVSHLAIGQYSLEWQSDGRRGVKQFTVSR